MNIILELQLNLCLGIVWKKLFTVVGIGKDALKLLPTFKKDKVCMSCTAGRKEPERKVDTENNMWESARKMDAYVSLCSNGQ